MDANKTPARIGVVEAARRMGVTPMWLRMALRLGKVPFGTAIQMPGGRWSYYINSARFEAYMTAADLATIVPTTKDGSKDDEQREF